MSGLRLALKVDVDTLTGTKVGVPNLTALLNEEEVPATFFFSLGPDNSGRALLRLFTQRGFLKKMWGTRALRVFGIRTVLSGTLLPAPLIGKVAAEVMRQVETQGQEVGLHAYDHVGWQDHLACWRPDRIAEEWNRGWQAFQEVFGHEPQCSAAPGWRVTAESLVISDPFALLYQSDTRGICPFFPCLGQRKFSTLQIPTTLPTLDELLWTTSKDKDIESDLLGRLSGEILNVYTLHAEFEGMSYLGWFRGFIQQLKKAGVTFVGLKEEAQAALGGFPPFCQVYQGTVPGRTGPVALQGEEIG